MRTPIAAVIFAASVAAPAMAQTIYPIDRADILAGSRFDFKVEYPDVQRSPSVTINGQDYAAALGKTATLIEPRTARTSPR